MKNIFALDVETTGLDPHKCSLVSVGVVDLCDQNKMFYKECRVWDGAEINSQALDVNGFSMAQVQSKEKATEAELIKELFKWLPREAIMVAHNSAFDKGFIQAAADRAEVVNPFSFRTIDIHSIVYMHMLRKDGEVTKRLSLNTCLQYFGLPKEPNPHNALTGALCNVSLFNEVRKSGKQADLFVE